MSTEQNREDLAWLKDNYPDYQTYFGPSRRVQLNDGTHHSVKLMRIGMDLPVNYKKPRKKREVKNDL